MRDILGLGLVVCLLVIAWGLAWIYTKVYLWITRDKK